MASRIMLVGDSGDGKSTAAILGMLLAGKEVFVADFDDAAGALRAGKIAKARLKPEHLAKLHVARLVDDVSWRRAGDCETIQGLTVALPKIEKARAMEDFLALQKDWDGAGPWDTWGPDKALVIDTGSEMSQAIVRLHMKLNTRSLTTMGMRDYRPCYAMEETVVQLLKSLKCWVVVLYHLMHVNIQDYADKAEEVDGPEKKKGEIAMVKSEARWPSTLGRRTAREQPIIKHFPIVLKAVRTANRYEVLAEPDDDTTFLRCPFDLPKRCEGIDAITRIVTMQDQGV